MPAPSPDMKNTIFLVMALVVAASVFWIVGELAKLPFTQAGFESRFPEKKFYKAAELPELKSDLIKLANNAQLSEYYRKPVLFPADLLVMILLAATMAAASYYWLGHLTGTYVWAALLLPAAYLLADLLEDGLLFWMLGNPADIPDKVGTLVNLTRAKLITIVLSMLQTGLLLVLYLVAKCRG